MLADTYGPDSRLVSIIAPARNASPWIAESLRSALAQTYRPIEIIVVDNGSTDDTREVAIAVGGSAVRVISESIPGPSAARNAGIEASRGDVLQFLDADDALVPDKIERQIGLLRDGVADVVWGAFVRARDDGRPLLEHDGSLFDPRLGADVEASLLEADGFVHLGATLIRRAAIGDLRFDTSVRVVEDVRFLCTLASTGARFVRSPHQSGYVMREHDHRSRASRVDRTGFWKSCAELAHQAEARWRSAGTLTPQRAATLARVHVGVARNIVREDPLGASAAIASARALTQRYYDAFPFRWRTMVRALGFERTEHLASIVRRVRHAWRG